jgi:hypothetical protein
MSLSLPAALQETTTIGGATTDNRNVAALVVAQEDYRSGTVTLIFEKGKNATTPTTFVASGLDPGIIVVLNLNTGVWTATNQATGALTTGTLTGAQLTAIKNNQVNFRNGIETVFGGQIYPSSTQVPN